MRHGLDTGFLVAFEAADHSQHTASHALVRQCLSNGDDFALAPQVLAELAHVLTDQNRFAQPQDNDRCQQHIDCLPGLGASSTVSSCFLGEPLLTYIFASSCDRTNVEAFSD
jgi:hypothetical protein